MIKLKRHMTPINLIAKSFVAMLFITGFLCSGSFSAELSSVSPVQDDGLSSLIQKRIAEWKTSEKETAGGERIFSAVLAESFYKARNYQPAWSENGRLTQVDTLIRAVDEAYGDGLSPDYYHLSLIKSLVDKVGKESNPDSMQLSDLDILMTDAFLTLGCHLSAGCVNPVTIETKWFAKSLKVDVSAVLEQALRKKQIREALTGLRPQKDIYNRLRLALARYRDDSSKTEWPRVSAGPKIKMGSKSGRVAELRKRLEASSDMTVDQTTVRDLFDDNLEQAVILFQKCHGLDPDGVVGRETINALNVPLRQRVRQLELNMERLRWILGGLEERFIVVNIADFQLDVIEKDKSVLSIKVVVGRPYQKTPIFTARMTGIVINPAWNIPDSIARKEILKKINEDPKYLSDQNIKIFRGWEPQEEAIDPEDIDWSKVSEKSLPYRFRQEPGPLNPLGNLKFMLPNEFDVYLHDTPSKGLFSRSTRTFSHGCIRIEKPLELAEYLLRDDPRWSLKELSAAIETGAEQIVTIPNPVRVHFLYLTAWVDDKGIVQFRNDIYGRDAGLDEALRRTPSFQ
jgi:L,D-transpeptidase YcbB